MYIVLARQALRGANPDRSPKPFSDEVEPPERWLVSLSISTGEIAGGRGLNFLLNPQGAAPLPG